MSRRLLRASGIVALSWSALSAGRALAEPAPAPAVAAEAEAVEALVGRPVLAVEVVRVPAQGAFGPLRKTEVPALVVATGEPFSPALARRLLDALLESGRFADAEAEVLPQEGAAGGVVLRLSVVPRRLVASVEVAGCPIATAELIGALALGADAVLTEADLPELVARAEATLAARGFPHGKVSVRTTETDEPLRVVLRLRVTAGPARRLARRELVLRGAAPTGGTDGAQLAAALDDYGAEVGDRLDERALEQADRALERSLRARAWPDARVEHAALADGGTLVVRIAPGLRKVVTLSGQRELSEDLLRRELDRARPGAEPEELAQALRGIYVAHGFFDAAVRAETREDLEAGHRETRLVITEGAPLRITDRHYPCLPANVSRDSLDARFDEALRRAFPGSDAVDLRAAGALFGGGSPTAAAAGPPPLGAGSVFNEAAYAEAAAALQSAYRADGYLDATVGPARLLRRACPAGRHGARCRFTEAPETPRCEAQEAPPACRPDPTRGVSCESTASVSVPVRLGRRTTLYAVSVSGNDALTDAEVARATGLTGGRPFSHADAEAARARLSAAYADAGFAFARVTVETVFSEDRTHAEVRLSVREGPLVRVSDVVIEGASQTSEALVRSRVLLGAGDVVTSAAVREAERKLGELGVFSSVSISLEDPDIPSASKRVVIALRERPSQVVEVRPGISTGEGLRMSLEYGHRNLAGRAIRLTARAQLGYLPDGLVFDAATLERIARLPLGERLEARNSVSLDVPDVGLGRDIAQHDEALYLHDVTPNYWLTRRALMGSLLYQPSRALASELRLSVEYNDASLLADGEASAAAFRGFLKTNPVPEGTSLALAERLSLRLDRRDSPVAATRGYVAAASVEHVRATPLERAAGADVAPGPSDFLRYSARLGVYAPLPGGLVLAGTLHGGFVQHLIANRQTYPDRLFFLGGVDSLRSFARDSLVPEDISERLLPLSAAEQEARLAEIDFRGGNVFVNPRVELRAPLIGALETALFVDSGNLWLELEHFEPWSLRYGAGAGLRLKTPVGPLAFDYGVNLDRRPWEDFGAFHFSIGLL